MGTVHKCPGDEVGGVINWAGYKERGSSYIEAS